MKTWTLEEIKRTNGRIEDVYRIDEEGFAYGMTNCCEIFVGYIYDRDGRDTWFMKATPANNRTAETYWQTNTFAKEARVEK